ncbi:GNAT family N-acetyltransferase [Piscinibacter sp. XHJ-5]|uniref:GNAT family N-acetyltransferase n=1 Tax=Piscinibacter sp. XHJ-5 TaxID=3037797 RepID=UPI002452A2B1|nr:GNAT family N-acetyltransferase [Piscinibacter sp. XHJ-5]
MSLVPPFARTVTLRPVRSADAPSLQAYVESLSAASRRLRFHGAINACAPGLLRRLTEADGTRHVAFVALATAPADAAHIVGEARYVVADGGDRAEFAISVADSVRGHGVAEALMQQLFAAARDAGIACLYGDVLADNGRMAAFLRRLGFELAWQVDAGAGIERWERATDAGRGRARHGLGRWLRGWSLRTAMPPLPPGARGLG